MSVDIESFKKDVYEVISAIPRGYVTTYGEIANLIGYPNHSRLVGRILGSTPQQPHMPCHRVVNNQGRTVPGWQEQRLLLEEEGVSFTSSGNVKMREHRWDFTMYETE